MLRARFYVSKKKCHGDYRPVKWPIKYPYWCTGETSMRAIRWRKVYSADDVRSKFTEECLIDALFPEI